MGTALQNERGKNLYEFWGDKITKSINRDLKATGEEILVNLASNEYFNVLDKKSLQARVVQPVFKDFSGGKYRVISFFAKKARGLMSNFVLENKIKNQNDLKSFNSEGYIFNEGFSTEKSLVFTRKVK